MPNGLPHGQRARGRRVLGDVALLLGMYVTLRFALAAVQEAPGYVARWAGWDPPPAASG